MAWTTPRTWATSEIVTAALMNAQLRDNLTELGRVYDKAVTQLEVVNTVTETTLYSKSIGAGHMGTNRVLRCTILYDYLNNTGGAVNYTWKVKFGSTTMWGDLNAQTNSATRAPGRFVFELANQNSASVQVLHGANFRGAPAAGSVAGIGDGSAELVHNFAGTATEDTSGDKTLDVTFTHGTANASISVRRQYALLELLPA